MINSVTVRVGLATVMLAGLTACSRHEASLRDGSALPPASVKVAAVGVGSHAATEEVVGTVRARSRAVIEAKVSGRITQFPVVTGQRVKSGELLVELDAREIRARLDQAMAVRDQAQGDLDRFSTLLKQEAVTRAEFDTVQARQRVALAAVTEAETLLAYTRMLAPFDGVVARKLADLGDLAAPVKPLLELEDPSRLWLEVGMPEALIGRIEQGSTCSVQVATLEQPLAGTVSEIAPASDSASRTFMVRIDLPLKPGLRAGLFGRVAIPVGEIAALRVPASAVVRRGQLEVAFVVEENRARLRLVKTGKRIADSLEIVSGIETNEVVVTEGAPTLIDGQPVQIR